MESWQLLTQCSSSFHEPDWGTVLISYFYYSWIGPVKRDLFKLVNCILYCSV